jgi:hypothetical protein
MASAAALEYPLTLTAQAKYANGPTTITSAITIRVDRLMDPAARTRALDRLKYNGYQGFMTALRPLPVVGQVSSPNARVDLRYAWETKADDRTRLILVADKPLFFLPADASKSKAGYELTVVDLMLDSKNAGSGTMAGAARVKPSPELGVILDDFGAAPVQLTVEPAARGKTD